MKFARRANRLRLTVALLALNLAVQAGCDSPEEIPPDRVEMVSGDNQANFPTRPLPEPLVVRLLGPQTRDFLGRKGSRLPARGVPVTFEVEDADEDYAEEVARWAERRRRQAKDGGGSTAAGEGEDLVPPSFPLLFPAPDSPLAEGDWQLEVPSDDSGVAEVYVRLGTENGDWRVEALTEHPTTGKKINEHFRMVSGVRKVNEISEASVGDIVPLQLQLQRWEEGKLVPLEDREVFFRIVGEPYAVEEGAAIRNRKGKTDEEGMRQNTDVTLGDRPGLYYVLAEVDPYVEGIDDEEEPDPSADAPESAPTGLDGDAAPPPEKTAPREDEPIRGILYRIIAMDWWLVVGQFAAGALLFLLGVRFLANGFHLILSPRLHFDTAPWMENRVAGYLAGSLMGVTFQSWSTVSFHLVSFANGGLLTARDGLVLVLGASLGATALPQVLSLELGVLAVPLLAVGILLIVLPRQKGKHSWGWVFLGGGLVLASWSLLDEAAELLALSESFQGRVLSEDINYSEPFLQYSGNLLWVLFLGLVCGFLLRTSNLLVILSILLASHGVFGAATGVPLIIGANLGSAALLLVRSLLKNREARRLAAMGLVFHLLTALFVTFLSIIAIDGASAFLWIVEWLAPGRLFHPVPESVGQHLAMSHTLYNLLGGLAFLAFPQVLVRITDRLLPRRGVDESPKAHDLDANLIPVPSLALRQVRREVIYLTELCRKGMAESFESFRYGDLDLSDHVVRRGETIAGIHRDISRYLVLVGENPLSRHDASNLQILQSAAGLLGRTEECAERLRDLTGRRLEEKVESSEETDRELGEVYDLVVTQFDNVLILLQRRDQRVEESVMKVVERLAKQRSRLETQWRQRVETTTAAGGTGVQVHMQSLIYREAFDLLFRVAEHLAHIAHRMRVLAPSTL